MLVVEHDEETIRSADHVIDIGPGAGTRGGQLIAQGSVEDIEASEKSLTGYYLKHPLQHTCKAKRRTLKSDPMITVQGANSHNLKDVTASFPLKRLTVLTGVSGSGKSTLAREVFLKNMAAWFARKVSPFRRRKAAKASQAGKPLTASLK